MKLEVNERHIEGEITGNPITVALELASVVRTVHKTLEESVGKELADSLAKKILRDCFHGT